VCEETVRKRLGEFKTTNTAKLTRGELNSMEALESDPFKFAVEEDNFMPPSLTKAPILKCLDIGPSNSSKEGDNAPSSVEQESQTVLNDLHNMLQKKGS